jgi:hypothetical protein
MFYLILTIAIFTLFVLYVYIKFGVLKSISESYYKLRSIGEEWWFIWFILCTSLGMSLIGQHPLVYVASGLLALVALSPMFKNEGSKPDSIDKLELQIHVFGATSSIIVGFIYLTFFLHEWYIWIPIVLFIIYALPKKTKFKWLNGISPYTWWIEIFAFGNIMSGFLISKI